MEWTISRAGETIFRDNVPVVDRVIEPGDYVVEASYGTVKAAQSVTALAGQSIGLTVILNVAASAPWPRSRRRPVTPGIVSSYDIYDEETGRLVTRSRRNRAR